ncbi:hypothetical protein B0H11DRAFT_2239566 [Mycena galericulata]|nr:hypothetical protein B0H11DRAFT_2239566 [Mycena galericulata]
MSLVREGQTGPWRIKKDFLHHFHMPRLDLLVWILVKKLAPSYYRKLDTLFVDTGRFRELASWRKAFKREWKRCQKAVITLPLNPKYRPDARQWRCTCEHLPKSRFLICKHLVQAVQPVPPIFFLEVTRNRTAPICFDNDDIVKAALKRLEKGQKTNGMKVFFDSQGQARLRILTQALGRGASSAKSMYRTLLAESLDSDPKKAACLTNTVTKGMKKFTGSTENVSPKHALQLAILRHLGRENKHLLAKKKPNNKRPREEFEQTTPTVGVPENDSSDSKWWRTVTDFFDARSEEWGSDRKSAGWTQYIDKAISTERKQFPNDSMPLIPTASAAIPVYQPRLATSSGSDRAVPLSGPMDRPSQTPVSFPGPLQQFSRGNALSSSGHTQGQGVLNRDLPAPPALHGHGLSGFHQGVPSTPAPGGLGGFHQELGTPTLRTHGGGLHQDVPGTPAPHGLNLLNERSTPALQNGVNHHQFYGGVADIYASSPSSSNSTRET